MDLIKSIREEKNIDISSERLFVEAFPKDNGGCLLYISMLNNSIKSASEKSLLYNSLVCKIQAPDELLEIANQLYILFSHILHNSELYYLNGTYLLILHTYKKADKKLRSFISEYCEIIGAGEVDSSLIREYYNCIFPLNAIEELIKKTL